MTPNILFYKTDKGKKKTVSHEGINKMPKNDYVMQLQARLWLINMICHEKHHNHTPGRFGVCHYKRSRLISLKFDFRAERNAPTKLS